MNFEDAIEVIFKHEGGYVNHPRDPGGETHFGISKRSYPNVELKTLTREEAADIYKRDFWDKCELDRFPAPLRLMVLDCAINQGPQISIGLLQAALGVKVDGLLGPTTFEALDRINPHRVLSTFAQRRFDRYFLNPRFAVFGEGWLKRLLDVSIICAKVGV